MAWELCGCCHLGINWANEDPQNRACLVRKADAEEIVTIEVEMPSGTARFGLWLSPPPKAWANHRVAVLARPNDRPEA